MKARFFALAALVLGLASCQQEFDGAATQVGGEVDFQLKVDAKELATRATDLDGDNQYGYDSAYGAIDYLCDEADLLRVDWTDVDLRYSLEVYDAEGLTAAPVKDRMVQIVDKYEPVTFDLRLVPNRDYQFVVFADFVPQGASSEANTKVQSELGLHHNINGTLQNITIKEDAINDECTDAYFATEPIRISNSAAQSIVLKRPYGKVRVIATDLDELNLNVEPKSVKVTYEAAHRATFNAVTGAIDAEYETKEYSYTYADLYKDVEKGGLAAHYYTADYDSKTDTNVNGVERHTHMTLFTDYILANVDQESIHFTMEVFDKAGTPIKKTHFNTDIPVQRNYLTTIVGNVLTTATEINVTIDDNFKGRHDIEVIFVSSFRELYEAVNDYKAGQVIIFEADIVDDDAERDIVILQKEGVNVVINGDGYKFDGCITINGDARFDGAETVLLQNIKFETERSAVDFIYAPTKIDNRYNYSHNITVDGCTFESETYNEGVVGIKLFTTYNAVIKNVSAKNMHSLAQFQSTDNKTVIENVKVENCKNGISLGNIALATIKGAEISAKGYGIRLDGEKTRTVAATIENATINAYIPVNIRKMNDAACNVKVEFVDNAAYLEGYEYEIAFCSNEYEDGVAPESPKGTFRLQNAEEARAYYGDITTFSAFDAAVNSTNAPEVVAEGNISMPGEGVKVERSVVLDFAGFEYNAGSDANSYWYALEIFGEYDVVVKNANFTRAGIYAAEGADVVFENGTINHKPERTSRYIFCAQSGSTITVKDGIFTNDRAKNSFFWADAATIIVEGGNFGGVASNNKVVLTNGGQVIIKGGTFNFDPTAWVAEDYKATKNGSTWTVALDTVGDETELAEVLANAENEKIFLAEDVDYGTVTLGELKDVVIFGNENAKVIFNTTADTKIENVTLNAIDFVYDGSNVNCGIVVNAEAKIDNLIIDGCSFTGTGEKKGRGLYGQNPNATIAFKNCTFENMGYPIYTMSAGGYKSLTVAKCNFRYIKSWTVMAQYGEYLGDLTVSDCNFENCTGGLVKTGAFTANHTFTFTNNTIVNSTEHPAKDWFSVNTSAATKVVSGNTKDGAEWTPADAEGLK